MGTKVCVPATITGRLSVEVPNAPEKNHFQSITRFTDYSTVSHVITLMSSTSLCFYYDIVFSKH